MIVKDQREALCVACEMERRAIGIYQRALTLTEQAGGPRGHPGNSEG